MKSEIPSPAGCPKPEPAKQRKFYRNAYINYFVRLFDLDEFKRRRVTEVARHAGKTWSAMHEDEKKIYRDMALKAPIRRRLGKQAKKKTLNIKNTRAGSKEGEESRECYVTPPQECPLPRPGNQVERDATKGQSKTHDKVCETQSNQPETRETQGSKEPTCNFEDTTDAIKPGRSSIYSLVYSSSSSSDGTSSPGTQDTSRTQETIDSTQTEVTSQVTDETCTTEVTSQVTDKTYLTEDTSQATDETCTTEVTSQATDKTYRTEDTSQATEETCPTEITTTEYTDETWEAPVEPKKSTRSRSIFSPTTSIDESPSRYSTSPRTAECTRRVCATPPRRKRRASAASTPRAPKRRRLSLGARQDARGKGPQSTPRQAKLDAIYAMSTQKKASRSRSKMVCGRAPRRRQQAAKRKLTFVSDTESEESVQPRVKRTRRGNAA